MGSLWMLLAAFLFACMSVLVKLGAIHFSSTELVFYRSLFGVWATYVIIRWYGFSVLTPHWRMHCWRGITGLISLLMFFYCLTQLPLGTAVSLNYTWPLFLALFSTLILKEHLQWPLIFAILLGFIGVIILLRPALPEEQWIAGLIGIASGFFAAIAYVNVKQLGNLGESEWHVVFYFTLISTLGAGAWLMLTSFSILTWHGLLVILGIGVTATLAQIAMTRAYHKGVTLVVTSLGYSTVLFASLWDLVLWNEVVTPITWLGIALIVIGGSMGGILGFRGISVSISK